MRLATATREASEPLTEGWFNHGAEILRLVDLYRPVVCVELGTWLGASAIPVARSVRRWGGTVTCVDTWAGELNEHGGSPTGKSPLMLWSCARAMVGAGVGASVRLIPATTFEVARTWTRPIDYLYVDADHSYEGVLADLLNWVPHVRRGGLIVVDDYGNDLYPGVRVAWDEFERTHGLTFTRFQSDPPLGHGSQIVYGVI